MTGGEGRGVVGTDSTRSHPSRTASGGNLFEGSAQAVKFPVGASVSISLELIDRKLVKEANLEQALVRKEQVRGEILEVVNRSRILHFPEHPILGQLKISSEKLQGTTILGAHTKVDSPTTAESSPGYHLFLCKNHYRQNHYPTNLNIPRLLRKGGFFFTTDHFCAIKFTFTSVAVHSLVYCLCT